MEENKQFGELKRGELTDIIYENLCYGKMFDKEEFDIEDIKKSVDIEGPLFIEGVVAQLQKLGLEVSSENPNLIVSEIKRRYKEIIGDTCPRTVLDWLRGTTPSITNRINNYNLCYALEMNLYDTMEFFVKYYLTVPFNYKDKTDAIFFYCLYHQKPYSVIKKMLQSSNNFEYTTRNRTKTLEIRNHILEIEDDEVFLEYLSEHCYSDELQYQIAKENIIYLIKKHNKNDMAKLHSDIMGFNYQDMILTKGERLNILPKEFRTSLPTDRTFLDIMKGKKETHETLRKTLIILLFYDYYDAVKKLKSGECNESEIRDYLLEFYEEVDNKLNECGLAPLYDRHPFDKLIIFCAASMYPLSTFHGLNGLRYSENDN